MAVLMVVNQTGNRIQRHITSRIVLHVNIAEKLVSEIVRNSEDTVDSGGVLVNPGIRQSGHLRIIISQVPNIQGLGVARTHFTRNSGRLIAVISPSFLIAKNLIVLSIALSVNFLIQHSLLTDIGELRPVIVKHGLTGPKTLNALLISMVITSNHNANHKTMLNKAFSEIRVNVGSKRHSASITERRRTGNGPGILNNLINTDRNTIATKILRTLKTSIRGSNSKMGLKGLNVPGTTSSAPFIKFLDLKCSTKLIDSSYGDSIVKLRIKISRPKITTTKSIALSRHSITTITVSISESLLRNRSTCTISHVPMHTTTGRRLFPGNIRTHRYNRRITKLSGVDGHIRALLRTRKTRSEIITELIGDKRLATFSNVRNIVTSIHALHSSIIHRDIKRVGKILRAKPLIHNKGVSSEGESGNREAFHTSRDTHIVSQSADFPTISGSSQLGDLILNLGNPSRFSVLTHKLFPMFPYQAVWNKEIIRIKIDVIHNRS